MDFCLPKDSLFLGLDCSTQSLKATILDSKLKITCYETVHFDSELPHFSTKDGVIRDPNETGRIFSPTLIWVEALDLLLAKLNPKLNFSKIISVSGSAQQHGSAYWKKDSERKLNSLNPNKGLSEQLKTAFSLNESPVWMDSSTTVQCREIEREMGGACQLASRTGSRAHERFTGTQIRKIFQRKREVYEITERISLVSSLMCSILIGRYACVDWTDGSGMNLMDIEKHEWIEAALEATAPGLKEKIGNLAPAYNVAGFISPYFVQRFGFNSNCLIVQWSGDNPNSLAGLTLSRPGDLAISLGTSDTVFGITTEAQASLDAHFLPNPVDPNSYMVMLCYKNGSLAREDGRNQFARKAWDMFNSLLEKTPPLNGGKIGFYFKEHEILPPLPVGTHRYIIKNFNADSSSEMEVDEVAEFDPPSEVRAIVEGQFLAMRAHAERVGMKIPPERIIATGGASLNKSILKIMSDIFGCSIYTVQRPDSASLGAALRSAHGWLCNEEGKFVPISKLYEKKLHETSLEPQLAVPRGENEVENIQNNEIFEKYGLLMKKRLEIESELVRQFGRV